MPLTEQLRLGDTVADCEMALGRIDDAEKPCREALEIIESFRRFDPILDDLRCPHRVPRGRDHASVNGAAKRWSAALVPAWIASDGPGRLG